MCLCVHIMRTMCMCSVSVSVCAYYRAKCKQFHCVNTQFSVVCRRMTSSFHDVLLTRFFFFFLSLCFGVGVGDGDELLLAMQQIMRNLVRRYVTERVSNI